MAVVRSEVGFTVLDMNGFVVAYATTYQEALSIIENNS
jgi:hypothetical protein